MYLSSVLYAGMDGISFTKGMFYKLVKSFSLLEDSISVAFEFSLASISSFLSYNARITPSEK